MHRETDSYYHYLWDFAFFHIVKGTYGNRLEDLKREMSAEKLLAGPDNPETSCPEIIQRPPSTISARFGIVREETVYVAEGERLRCGNCERVCGEKLIGYVEIRCRGRFCQTINYFYSSRNPQKD